MKSLSLVVFLVACGGSGSDRVDVKPAPLAQVAPSKIDAPAVTLVEQPKATETPKPAVAAPKVPAKFDDAMTEGRALAAKGDRDNARMMFESAAILAPKQAAPHVELARLAITAGQKAVAIREASKAVARAPESSQAYNTLGRAELLRFDYDKAEVAFRQATELDATNAWAWNNLGLVYLDTKRYAEAADALATATSLPTAAGFMFNNLGTAYEQLAQLDDARVAFDKGGKLGSKEAAESQKRLKGVRSLVAIAPTAKAPDLKDKTYAATDEDATPPDAAPAVEQQPDAEQPPAVTNDVN